MSQGVKRQGPPAVANPADLRALALRRFVCGERLDIQGLADELGVSRATAYRWAGGNVEALTSTVVGALLEATFARCLREAQGRTGWARVLDAEERGLRYIASFAPYTAFVAGEGERALRIVASKAGLAHPLNVRLHRELLEEEERAGNVRLPVDASTLAYAMVRIAESFLYADLILGERPDVDKAMQVMRLLCRDPGG
jgi:hypothetical protein